MSESLALEGVSERLARGKDEQRFTGNQLSSEKRLAIEEKLKSGVGLVRTAMEVGASATTVSLVRDQLIEREPELFKRHMTQTLHRLANKTAAVIEKSIDNLEQEGVKANQIPGISIALGILLDKQASLMGDGPIQVVEHRVRVDAEQVRKLMYDQAYPKKVEPVEVEITQISASN